MSATSIALLDETATRALGATLASRLAPGTVIHLDGELGAGKTTLARGLIQALLPETRVRSPTYTLVECYPTPAFDILHLDLYRLAGAEELEQLAVRERVGEAVFLIEWPQRGAGLLPAADLVIQLNHAAGASGRIAHLTAASSRGRSLVAAVVASRPKELWSLS